MTDPIRSRPRPRRRLADLDRTGFAPEPLGGGITNVNFVVEDNGRKYVARIGEDIPVHQVMRFNELAASRAAHAAGLSPPVVHAEPGALVLDHIEATDPRRGGGARRRDAGAYPALGRPLPSRDTESIIAARR